MNLVNTSQNHTYLYWSPRILGIFIITLFSLLSLDVFGEYTGWELVIALFMHLVPAIILTISLYIGWKNELYGTILFNMLAIITVFFFNSGEEIMLFVILTLPLLIIAELFFYQWYKDESRFK